MGRQYKRGIVAFLFREVELAIHNALEIEWDERSVFRTARSWRRANRKCNRQCTSANHLYHCRLSGYSSGFNMPFLYTFNLSFHRNRTFSTTVSTQRSLRKHQVGADRELREVVPKQDKETTHQKIASKGIKWIYHAK